LASRAQALVAEERPLEAIHLAEIALAGAPDHQGALDAYGAAHRQLLSVAPSRNRWYQYWLKSEIEATERRRTRKQ
jgi:hypothetical protein